MTISNVPSWIQALAALGALGVTWWLARLTGRYVRETEKIATSSEKQVNQALQLAGGEQRAIAGALLEEVARIRTELGVTQQADEAPALPSGTIAPSVHPWIQPIVPRIGQSDASVVGLFLTLDRNLANHRTAFAELESARGELKAAKDNLERAEALDAQPSGPLAIELEKLAANLVEARLWVSRAEHNARTALNLATVTFRRCRDDLEAIQTRLRPLILGS